MDLETLLARARRRLDDEDAAGARDDYAEALAHDPDHGAARRGLATCRQRLGVGAPETFATRVAENIRSSSEFLDQAARGWVYTLLMDGDFVCDALERPPRPEATGPGPRDNSQDNLHQAPLDASDPEALLAELGGIDGVQPLWAQLRALPRRRDTAVLADSFADATDASLPAELAAAFRPDTVNVVIIGAGCIGLTLASSLKLALGDHCSVLVIENRVERPHVKRPYSRRWLTNVPLSMVRGQLCPSAIKILETIGDHDFIGAPINVFETLALLSCKALGVRFLFQRDYDLSFVQAAGVHLIFDATGGRLHVEDTEAPPQPGPTCTLHDVEWGRGNYTPYGVTKLVSMPRYDIETEQVGATVYPLHEGRRVQMGMLKVTHIPGDMYLELLEHVERSNSDCRFYLWPGTLAPEINELLLFINLLPAEYALLAAEIDRPTPLPDLLKQRRRLVKLDRRVGALLKRIAREAEAPEEIDVEPPFVLAPYARPYPERLPRRHGVEVLAVGDSMFNGNPKVGNGLAKHLLHVGAIHNAFLVG